MERIRIILIALSCCLCVNAQTTRFVNVGLSIATQHQNWVLNSIYVKPFYTIFTWTVECKDMTSSVYLPDNIYIEDLDTHVRYGLAKKTIAINPSTFNQKIKYEVTFKGIPQSVKYLKCVTPYFTVNNINLNGGEKGENTIQLIAESQNEDDILEKDITMKELSSPIISDIDINIPTSNTNNGLTFAIVIANENYQEVENVPDALNDGTVFAEYCNKTLGIPESNIKLVKDATLNNIKRQVNWIDEVLEAYNGEASVIFYYAGHGIPDESNRTSYLLPVDGFGTDVSTGYSLDKLYADLNSKPAKSVLVLLDACFSGTKRDGGMLASARGVAIKAKQNEPKGNMVVLSAAQGDETAYPYEEKGHGMFTYFILKKLQETKGDVTLGDLSDYVTSEVKKRSVVVNGKMQTPLASASSSVTDWRNWKLK